MNFNRILLLITISGFIACNHPQTENKTTEVPVAEETIITEEKSKTKSSAPEYLISKNEFYGVSLQDNLSEIQKNNSSLLEKYVKKTAEADFEVYKILSTTNEHLADIYPKPNNTNLVGQIEIISPKAETREGLKIGSTYKELLDKLGSVEVHGSEIEGRTYASKNNIYYQLDTRNFTYEIDPITIKPNTEVLAIILR